MPDVVLTTLTNGTTADATLVMANFNALKNAANAKDAAGAAAGAFSATKPPQSIPSYTPTKLTWPTEDFDVSNWFASDRYTPQAKGIYRLSTSIVIPSPSAGSYFLALYVYKNGVEECFFAATGGQGTGVSGSILVAANGTSDYFEIYAYNGGASAADFGTVAVTNNRFQGELVGLRA